MTAIIPPPLVFIICGALMWLIAALWPSADFSFPYSTVVFWLVLLAGLLILAGGAGRIIKHRTVIHPDRRSLQKATTLVTTGVFRYTRNPIYLGMAIMLCAWTIFLENWWALVGPVIFVAFITRYQIKAEEEVLEKIFGAEYLRYKSVVRRWM